MSSISEIIIQRRKELGLSQLYISDALGYCVQTISKWEKGKSIPSLLSWGALAKVLQIDLDALIDGKLKSEYNSNCLNNTFSYEKFANNLRRQRKIRDMTQKELAAKLSISYQTLLAWEKGTTFPNIEQFKQLSIVLGLSYDELYFVEVNLVVCEPNKNTNINTNKEQIANKKIKVKFWPIISKSSIALILTYAIIFGVTTITSSNPFNHYYQSSTTNLPISDITGDSLTVGSNTSSQNHQSNSDNLPSSDIVSTNNSVSEDDKKFETLGKPYKGKLEILRYYYESSDPADIKAASLVKTPLGYMKSVGVDYIDPDGKSFDVVASLSGKVVDKLSDPTYGNVLIVEHELGIKTKYASLGIVNVDKGQEVKKGEAIATSGKSEYTNGWNSCLHFEVMKGDNHLNPAKSYDKALNTL